MCRWWLADPVAPGFFIARVAFPGGRWQNVVPIAIHGRTVAYITLHKLGFRTFIRGFFLGRIKYIYVLGNPDAFQQDVRDGDIAPG